jgi:hypothetical protein
MLYEHRVACKENGFTWKQQLDFYQGTSFARVCTVLGDTSVCDPKKHSLYFQLGFYSTNPTFLPQAYEPSHTIADSCERADSVP